jgi:hypothetical protein
VINGFRQVALVVDALDEPFDPETDGLGPQINSARQQRFRPLVESIGKLAQPDRGSVTTTTTSRFAGIRLWQTQLPPEVRAASPEFTKLLNQVRCLQGLCAPRQTDVIASEFPTIVANLQDGSRIQPAAELCTALASFAYRYRDHPNLLTRYFDAVIDWVGAVPDRDASIAGTTSFATLLAARNHGWPLSGRTCQG